MTIRTTLIASSLIAASLVSGAAHAALQGRDMDGYALTFEAYYDTVLDITWLADANYAKTQYEITNGLQGISSPYGTMTWADATAWTANLTIVDGINNITYDNWRLPTVSPINGTSFNYSASGIGSTDVGYNITSSQSELSYMFYVNLGNPGNRTPEGVFINCVDTESRCLDNVGPFKNLQTRRYWYGTEDTRDNRFAWNFDMSNGYQDSYDKATAHPHAWAVSSGDVGIAAVPEADTWAMLLAGLGLVGAATKRRRG